MQQLTSFMGSVRGVPEGCGYSVCAMMRLKQILNRQLEGHSTFSPQARISVSVNWGSFFRGCPCNKCPAIGGYVF